VSERNNTGEWPTRTVVGGERRRILPGPKQMKKFNNSSSFFNKLDKTYQYIHIFWHHDIVKHGHLINWIILILVGLFILVFFNHIISGE
jgi:hypothetical protein